MGERAHLGRFDRLKVAFAIPIPKLKPRRKMMRLKAQRQVFQGHLSGIIRRTTRRARPKLRYLIHVFRPILDAGIKDWPNHLVLPHIGIKLPEKRTQLPHAADTFKQGSFHWTEGSTDCAKLLLGFRPRHISLFAGLCEHLASRVNHLDFDRIRTNEVSGAF